MIDEREIIRILKKSIKTAFPTVKDYRGIEGVAIVEEFLESLKIRSDRGILVISLPTWIGYRVELEKPLKDIVPSDLKNLKYATFFGSSISGVPTAIIGEDCFILLLTGTLWSWREFIGICEGLPVAFSTYRTFFVFLETPKNFEKLFRVASFIPVKRIPQEAVNEK